MYYFLARTMHLLVFLDAWNGSDCLIWLTWWVVFMYKFVGGFNQPIMCGGEPRAMLEKARGKADSPIYTIQLCVPKHG